MRRRGRTFLLAFLVMLAAAAGRARPVAALVGPSEPGARDAAHVVMVLARHGRAAGFCSGSVLTERVVLTAAHCVSDLADTRIHFRDASGTPVLLGVAHIAVHPLYRADAVRLRERSVDLALVELASPLPASFAPVRIGSPLAREIGTRFRISGFGLAQDNKPASGGTLRSGYLALRAPASSLLLWAEDPAHRGFGACTGDSGAPIFDADGDDLVAVADWATGSGGRPCGALTQATWIAPQRAWIEDVLRRWGM